MKEKITSYQFLAIMFLVPYGTASLFFVTPDTKNDIWIAMLFYSLVSIIIQMIYISLFNKYPEDSIVTYLPKIYGKYIGFILSIAYISFFAYDAARDLRDFIELPTSFALIRTPMYIIAAVFMIVITYSVYKGIENIGNMAQLGFIIMIFSIILVFILLSITDEGVFKFYNLLPILHGGFIPLVSKGWKLSMFPYGEFITMIMLYPFLMQKSKLKKTVIFTSILEGIFLALNNILFIVTLGYEFAVSSNYPLLQTLRLVHIGDFLNRLDIIFIVILMLGGFFKISVLMYVSALGISQVFKLKNWGLLCIILGTLIFITSLIIARNNPEHINIGWNFALPYIFLPIVFIIPLISLIIYYLKKLIRA
ncbi:GerAB/ArcD/ProY family transporter [Clostridium pasteurianum]|uniref:Spore germination protein, amino acid permease n=1 Tax=Clostridium pasteurianum BC1 TaxID=86416 RepID=R4KAS6_CLOPA|nr:GerAB/ArcD/ProY family transporter [Clostridium pasteurianum]AGK97614.1 spore germination protein, amino acid permease [Clostridium pasteurianum BC1]